jgi:hypothetical protein
MFPRKPGKIPTRDDLNPPLLRRGGPVGGVDPTQPGGPRPPGPPPPAVAPPVSPVDPQAAAKAAAKQKAHAATMAMGDESDVGDLASLKQQHDRERDAAQHELDASKAQALQTAAAKSGAAGFGLSGASAALQGDVGRAADRNAVLTMADLRGKQNDENFAELQREVALNDAEEADDTDYNRDGFINGVKIGGKVGDGNPDNNPARDPADQRSQDKQDAAKVRGNFDGDGGAFSPYTGTAEDAKALLAADPNFSFDENDARVEHDHGVTYVVVRGSDGKLYKIQVDESDVDDSAYIYEAGHKTLVNAGLA